MGLQQRSGSAPRQHSFARHPDARSKPDQRPAWNVSAQLAHVLTTLAAGVQKGARLINTAPDPHRTRTETWTSGSSRQMSWCVHARAMHGRVQVNRRSTTAVGTLRHRTSGGSSASPRTASQQMLPGVALSTLQVRACMHASAQVGKCHLTGNLLQHSPVGPIMQSLRRHRTPASCGVLRVLVCKQTGPGTRAQAVSTRVKEAAARLLLPLTMVLCCRCCGSQRGGAVQGPAPHQVQARCSSPPQWPPHPDHLRRKQQQRQQPWQKLPVGCRWT